MANSNIFMIFPIDNGEAWSLTYKKRDEYKETYGEHIDVEHELRKAKQWLVDNPAKRKTGKGMPRFLNSWLGMAEQRVREATVKDSLTAQPLKRKAQ